MLPVLLSIILLLAVWYLVKTVHANHQKHCELAVQEYLQSYVLEADTYSDILAQNQDLLETYSGIGQSLAALHIQIQVAQKLWQLNPQVAQQSLLEAYQLSGSLMYEVRHIVKSFNQVDEMKFNLLNKNIENLKSNYDSLITSR